MWGDARGHSLCVRFWVCLTAGAFIVGYNGDASGASAVAGSERVEGIIISGSNIVAFFAFFEVGFLRANCCGVVVV